MVRKLSLKSNDGKAVRPAKASEGNAEKKLRRMSIEVSARKSRNACGSNPVTPALYKPRRVSCVRLANVDALRRPSDAPGAQSAQFMSNVCREEPAGGNRRSGSDASREPLLLPWPSLSVVSARLLQKRQAGRAVNGLADRSMACTDAKLSNSPRGKKEIALCRMLR